MRDWIRNNKEWLFSGILVYLIGGISAKALEHLPLLGVTVNLAIWHIITAGGILAATISILASRQVRRFKSQVIELRSAAAEAKAKSSLEEIDPLTGLENLRRLKRFFIEDLPLCNDAKQEVWGIMLDIDNFRLAAENLSIVEASDLLEEVGSRWQGHESDDIVMRWGGDEFLAIAPDSSQNGAEGFANRLQKALSRTPLYVGDENHKVELSATAGISRWNAKTDSERSFQERLGKALAQAKEEGSKTKIL